MNVLNPKSWGTALGAGLIATVALLPQAKGELVYETGAAAPSSAPAPAAAAAANAQVEDRTTMRQALGASEKVQVTLQTQQAAPAPTEVAPPATVTATAISAAPAAPVVVAPAGTGPSVTETENMSKAELMRRERQREELKNEDILQARLEELRLRDERRRTDEMLNAGAAAAPTGAAISAAPTAAAPNGAVVAAPGSVVLKEEVVTAPVADHPGKPSLAPAMAPAATTVSTTVVDTPPATNQSSMSLAPNSDGMFDGMDRTRFSISPMVGISNLVGNSGGYIQVTPHISGGIGASMEAGDYFAVEGGWLYNQYGVAMTSSNPIVYLAQQQAAYTGQSNFESLNMNQNVLNLGLKVHLLGPDSRFRPFISGGGAYSWTNTNYTQQIQQAMSTYYGPQANVGSNYSTTAFLGYLGGGADFKITRHISVGGEFRYYAAFSSSSNTNYSPFTAGYGGVYGGNGVNALTSDPSVAGNSLAGSSFYSILGNVTFTF